VGQGAALAQLIRASAPAARSVLDCSCGIGTQAIGLALRGYRVTGTDVSERSLERARREAGRLGAELELARADFRDLSGVGGRPFDVVLSCDNALPHMLDPDDLERALRSMSAVLAPGGTLVVSTRDYDAALRERPPVAPPTLIAGPPRRIVVRLQDWDGPDSRLHTVRFLIITEHPDGWRVVEHRVRYRAATAGELAALAESAGLTGIRWHAAADLGYHQPVMTARRR
jgi:SAM-dependent methyltransferase